MAVQSHQSKTKQNSNLEILQMFFFSGEKNVSNAQLILTAQRLVKFAIWLLTLKFVHVILDSWMMELEIA